MIQPKSEHKPAGKNRTAIKAALACLRDEDSDGGRAVQLQSLIEQACNYYLSHGCFPTPTRTCKPSPCSKWASCPTRQTMAASMARRIGCTSIWRGAAARSRSVPQIRAVTGVPRWTEPQTHLPLPDPVVERLQAGECLAPTLREIAEPDGTRYAVLDLIVEVPVTPVPDLKGVRRVLRLGLGSQDAGHGDGAGPCGQPALSPLFLDTGGFDGRQAHTRRHIDRLKQKVAKLEARRDQFPVGDRRREPSERKLGGLRREIARCWSKYEARNNDLAHMAANMLILLATCVGSRPDCR